MDNLPAAIKVLEQLLERAILRRNEMEAIYEISQTKEDLHCLINYNGGVDSLDNAIRLIKGERPRGYGYSSYSYDEEDRKLDDLLNSIRNEKMKNIFS